MKKLLIAAILSSFALVGCTDAERSSWGALGSQANIVCYSGGEVIATYQSTGKVMQIDGDGISFRDNTSGKYVRAYADCIVEEK